MCGALLTVYIRLEALMYEMCSLDHTLHLAGGIDI